MELAKHLGPDQILLSVEVKDKWELLDLMVDAIFKGPTCQRQPPEVLEKIRPAVIKREKVMSTGMGHGYALPHARIKGFRGFAICIAVLKTKIDYETIDDEPVKIICLVITPEENPTIVLKILGGLSCFLLDDTANYIFYHEHDPVRMYNYLKEKRINLDISITAKEIMRAKFPSVYLDTPLRKVTNIMFGERIEAIAVVDEDGMLKGEITCDLLFKKGIPDFFNQLSSVSFIKEFDPFEKYFGDEANSSAKEVMSTSPAIIDETATLMEIVYLLSVKRCPKVYVVQDGKLCGTIDRVTVLDRILNL